MRDLYLSWSEQARRGLKEGLETPLLELGSGPLLICGMGGSGIVGDYAASLAYSRLSRPVFIVKEENPPAWVDGETAVIAISYSGSTLETLRCLDRAAEHTRRIAMLSSGGRILELSREKGYPLIRVTEGLVPRAALAEMLYALLGYMEALGEPLASREEVEESIRIMESPPVEAASEIAPVLSERLPVILSTPRLYPLAVRWKNELNENAKMQAKAEVLPEWGHNDVVGWEKPVKAPYAFIIIDSQAYTTLLDFASEWYGTHGPVIRVELGGKSPLSMFMYGSLLAGLVSLELASIRKVDPLATRGITLYKQAYKRA